MPNDEAVSLVAEVKSVSVRQMATKRAQIMNVVVTDGNGDLNLTFFANIWKAKKDLTKGTRALFSGTVSAYQRQKQLTQPLYELLTDFEGAEGIEPRSSGPTRSTRPRPRSPRP